MAEVDAARAVANLKELRSLTGDEAGAQRVAWTDTWIRARDWFREQLEAIEGVAVERDAAGNVWATLPGESDEFVIVGGHIDSVPDGGWLDGALSRTSRGRGRSSSSTGPTRRARASAAR